MIRSSTNRSRAQFGTTFGGTWLQSIKVTGTGGPDHITSSSCHNEGGRSTDTTLRHMYRLRVLVIGENVQYLVYAWSDRMVRIAGQGLCWRRTGVAG
ncbi:hypothetical protein EYC84_004827 [Monilinia fructicola]|uniref:Uncharacterized protein n=1 Tax=Monilinia fructicola TaxID=38448 RepID=A0A5M9K9Z3_MONFR|nr:hypothetical protein EYC84_004827 [Monilinia fructicola]